MKARNLFPVEMLLEYTYMTAYSALGKELGLRTFFDHGLVKDLNSQRAAHSWLRFLAFGFIPHTPCKAPAADCINIAVL